DVQMQAARVVRPGTARTVEPTVLVVHGERGAHALDGFGGVLEDVPDAAGRSPTRGRMVVLVPRVPAVRRGPPTDRRPPPRPTQHVLFGVHGSSDIGYGMVSSTPASVVCTKNVSDSWK